jgi:hypothetical protein
LKLNTITVDGEHSACQPGLHRNSMLSDHALRQSNYLLDRLIEIKMVVPRGRFSDLIPDPVDNASGSISIAYDTAQRFPDFAQVWRASVQEILSRPRVVTRATDRLVDFVSDRSRELTQSRYATYMGKFGLHRP